jgi:hypothetical protein
MGSSERPIALLLTVGTGLATLLVALGLVLPPGSRAGAVLNLVGVGLFIALPVGRVLLMFVQFVRQRDAILGAAALAVLLIIALGSTAAVMLGR